MPRNDAPELPLAPETVRDFRRHLERTLEALAAQEPARARGATFVGGQDAVPPEAERSDVLARACAACRGWCCRRGGSHAFLDEASLARVRSERPEWSRAEVVARYLAHAGPTHLAGGCLFQGPEGCRLPVALRSDRCTRWWCEDLRPLLTGGAADARLPSDTHFVAVATGEPPPRSRAARLHASTRADRRG